MKVVLPKLNWRHGVAAGVVGGAYYLFFRNKTPSIDSELEELRELVKGLKPRTTSGNVRLRHQVMLESLEEVQPLMGEELFRKFERTINELALGCEALSTAESDQEIEKEIKFIDLLCEDFKSHVSELNSPQLADAANRALNSLLAPTRDYYERQLSIG